MGGHFRNIKQNVLDEAARRTATSAMMKKDKRLDAQSLRNDIDALANEVAKLREAIEELRKR